MKPKAMLLILFAAALIAVSISLPSVPAQTGQHRIEVTAKRFNFTPAEITLKKGEPAVLVLQSADVAHGLRFKELGVSVNAGKGQTAEVAFTPDRTGTFVGHCSVFCGSGHGSMTLTLHVVE